MSVISPVFIIIYSLIGFTSAYFAKKNGRNPYLWFAMGVFFGVLALIAMFFIKSKHKKAPILKKPTPIIDSKLWYYSHNDEQMGPVSLNKLSLLLHEGKINFTTLVWNEELDSWKLLNETKEYSLLMEKSTL